MCGRCLAEARFEPDWQPVALCQPITAKKPKRTIKKVAKKDVLVPTLSTSQFIALFCTSTVLLNDITSIILDNLESPSDLTIVPFKASDTIDATYHILNSLILHKYSSHKLHSSLPMKEYAQQEILTLRMITDSPFIHTTMNNNFQQHQRPPLKIQYTSPSDHLVHKSFHSLLDMNILIPVIPPAATLPFPWSIWQQLQHFTNEQDHLLSKWILFVFNHLCIWYDYLVSSRDDERSFTMATEITSIMNSFPSLVKVKVIIFLEEEVRDDNDRNYLNKTGLCDQLNERIIRLCDDIDNKEKLNYLQKLSQAFRIAATSE